MHSHSHSPRVADLTAWAWLSLGAAVATIALKGGAYVITGSVGLLSDALESVVNLVAALMALLALRIAMRPPDASHPFGHGKVEYFSAGAEGLMIVAAAAMIIYSAVERLISPRPLEDLRLGLAITVLATVINGVVGLLILRAGRRHRSLVLVADGHHLLTDVWTSVGVVIGVAAVGVTGWLPLDSIVAIGVAANIVWMGVRLMRSSVHGLMDHALDDRDVGLIVECLRECMVDEPDVLIHGLRTRESGRERFVSMHVLVPGDWSVARGHEVLELIQSRLVNLLPEIQVHTHLEPREDPRSYDDAEGGLSVETALETGPLASSGPGESGTSEPDGRSTA